MKSVRIKTEELLAVLKDNRKKHQEDYETALIGYRQSAIAELTRYLNDAIQGGKIVRSIRSVEPVSYIDSYNTVIRMLEMSDDSSVELSMSEFSQYVEDKWVWKDAFTSTSSIYNNR